MNPVRYASFSRRLVAYLLDYLLLLLITMPFNAGLSLNTQTGSNFALSFTQLITLGLYISYQIFFLVKYNGQTLGKRAMHIRVVREDNQPLDVATVVVRLISTLVSSIVLYLGYIWVLFDSKKQSWHDKIAKTLVVEADETKPNKIFYFLGCCLPITLIVIFVLVFSSIILAAVGLSQVYKNSATSTYETTQALSEQTQVLFDNATALNDQIRTIGQTQTTSQAYTLAVKPLADQMIIALKSALTSSPDQANLWNLLGIAYSYPNSTGSIQDSILAYQKAVELAPDNATYHSNLGIGLANSGDNDKAALELKQAVRLQPNSGLYHTRLADVYLNLKLNQDAWQSYKNAIAAYQKDNTTGQYDAEILELQKILADWKF